MAGMKYVGNGDFVAGVPARDLSADEVTMFGRAWLLSKGLYQEIKTKRKPVRKKIKPVEEDYDDKWN